MKKFLFLFVALFATISLRAYDFQSGELYYNITSETTAEVTYEHFGGWDWRDYPNYSKLTTVTIPSTVTYDGTTYSVTSIENYAFHWCSSLTSITIPNSITKVGGGMFYGCENLESVVLSNNIVSLPCGDYGAFGIGENTGFFGRCYSLTSITIPNSVTSIGDEAFFYCSSLTSIIIPNSVTLVGGGVFYGCKNLKSVVLSNNIVSLPSSCNDGGPVGFFDYCSSLTSLTIPNSVTSIGNCAFRNCSSLTSITCLGTTPPEAGDLGANTSTCKLIVPHSAYNAYVRHAYWGQFLNIVSGNWVENRDMTIIFTNSEDNDSEILSQVLTITFPAAPEIEGFTFLGWKATDEFISDVITIQAIYEANAPASAPDIYINPANPAQKLLRNGQVYILKDDKTYTIMGAQIQ